MTVEELPGAVFAAESAGRLRYRRPLVTYANAFEPRVNTLWMSPQVEAITGYRPEDWVGRPEFFEQLVHPDDRPAVVEALTHSREELAPFSRSYRVRTRAGGYVWIHDESVPVLDEAGTPQFIHGWFVDISERRRLEEALLHSRKTESLGRLTAGIAHDFNNVLTAIRGHVDLAERGLRPDDPAHRHVRAVRDAAERAARLARQLVTFSRRSESSPEPVDLGAAVADLVPMLRHLVGESTILTLDLAATSTVEIPLGRLEQVVMNLAANARDAMPEGGRVDIRLRRVTVGEADAARLGIRAGRCALLFVGDTGQGMDGETASRAFEPFFTTKERGDGAGLGLAIVRDVAREAGGAVEIASTVGLGTNVWVLLPVADFG